jgi:fructose-bisphosphate aldolase class II
VALVTLKELLDKAEAGGYAVGAFNCNNMEIVQAIMEAAESEKAPVILQASQGAIKYAGIDYIAAMVRLAAEQAKIPVALHLDHGTDFDQVMLCIRHGFSSVMIDGSRYPLQENIAATKKVMEIARAVGVSVEGELGRIGGTEDQVKVSEREASFTDPQEARIYVQETGVDAFAPSVGTAHGQYHGRPELDFRRLAKIRQLTGIPLVLHGSSGVPDEEITEAISKGVRKVNIDTNIREAFVAGIKEAINKNPAEIDPRKLLGPAREAACRVIREKIRLFGSSGQAWI